MTAKDIDRGADGRGSRRRSCKKEEKHRIAAEPLESGASVAEVARRYGLNANLLLTWRRRLAAPAQRLGPGAWFSHLKAVHSFAAPAMADKERLRGAKETR